MKKLITFILLIGISLLNIAAGCGSNSSDPQPDNFQSLIGKWQLQTAAHNITKQNGTTIIDQIPLKERGVVIIWEFFKDGRLVATQDSKNREIRWELNVKQLDGKDINDGQLKIIGQEEKEVAKEFGQTGDLTYEIDISSPNFGLPAIMNLRVDVTSIGNYKKHILDYTYHKL